MKRKKTGGRKAGTKNQNTIKATARELAESLGCDPMQILIAFANNDWQALGYDAPTKTKIVSEDMAVEVEYISPDLRLSAAKEAAKYCYPTLKSVELSGNNDKDPIKTKAESSFTDQMLELTATLLKTGLSERQG